MTANEIVCESRIDAVIVHARGALVSRVVSLPATLPAEPVDLVVRGVTLLALAGGARVQADGERAVIAMRARRNAPAGPVARGDVASRIVAAERAYWQLNEAHKAALRERDRLMALTLETDIARRSRRVDPSARMGDALAATQLIREQIEKVDVELRTLDEAMEKNDRERRALAIEGAQSRPADVELAASRRTLEFVVRLAKSDAALRALTLTYAVDAARWWPAYTARFSQGGARVAWVLEALVAQDSGEDWDAVNLSLSTADLVHDARLPELPSLRLGRAQPSTKRGFRPPPAGLEQLFAGYDRARQSLAEAAVPPPPPLARPSAPARQAAIDELSFGGGASRGEITAAMQAAPAMPGAPPPPPSAAPMPQSASMLAASAPRGGMVAKARMSFQGIAGSLEEQAPEGQASFGVAEQPSGPDETWLDFDALTLGSVTDRHTRGRLVRGGEAGDAAARQRASRNIESVTAPRDAVDPMQSRGHFDHRYDAAARCDVPANARLQRVTLASAESDVEMRFRTVPREQNDVFREATLRNPFDTPLLTGPVDVFFDDALLTASRIAFIDRGGTLRVGLGVEERVRVARNARADESTAGLLGGSTAIDHHVAIELSSSLGRAVSVDVIDRMPVTDDKEIDVTLLSSQPRAENYDQADLGVPVRGGLRMRVDVPAGGRARAEFAYRIKLPAKSEVVGGNRRE